MDTMRSIFLLVMTAASLIVAWQLSREKWLELVAKPFTKKGKVLIPGWAPTVAIRVCALCAVCSVSYASLLFYDVAAMTNAAVLGQVMSVVSNISLLAFIACVVWTYLTMMRELGEHAKFSRDGVRVTVIILLQVVLLTVSSVLFV